MKIIDPLLWPEICSENKRLFDPISFLQSANRNIVPDIYSDCCGALVVHSVNMLCNVAEILPKPVTPRNGSFVFNLEGNKKAVLLSTGVGAPMAVSALEMLAATSVKRIITIGNACWIGDTRPALCVPPCGISGTGVTRFYLRDRFDFKADGEGYTYLSENMPVADTGKVFSLDALYRLTGELVGRLRRLGVSMVDQETSACFAFGEYSVEKTSNPLTVSSILLPLDSIAGSSWRPNSETIPHEQWKDNLSLAVKAAMGWLAK
jgi:hypothetical protein